MDHFIMPKTESLSFLEEATLLVLCRQGLQNDGMVHISREAIANKIGIKELDTISKYTKKLQTLGYIEKKDAYDKRGHNLVKYSIKVNKHFRVLSNNLYNINPKLAVFVARIADYRVGKSNDVYYNNRTLAEKIGVKERTFYNYIKEAINLGIVSKLDDGYHLSEEWFPRAKQKLTKAELNDVKKLAQSADSKVARMAKWFMDNELQNQDNCKDLYNRLLAGTLNVNTYEMD